MLNVTGSAAGIQSLVPSKLNEFSEGNCRSGYFFVCVGNSFLG